MISDLPAANRHPHSDQKHPWIPVMPTMKPDGTCYGIATAAQPVGTGFRGHRYWQENKETSVTEDR